MLGKSHSDVQVVVTFNSN